MLRQGSPKHADILLITRTLTKRSHHAVLDIYSQIPSPKAVVAIGSCPGERECLRRQPHGRRPGGQIHPSRCLGVRLPAAAAADHCRHRAGGSAAGGGSDRRSTKENEAVLNELWQYV
ncbi:MAG: hypothetical protein WBX30_32690, partial [Stellaceae bacterium]